MLDTALYILNLSESKRKRDKVNNAYLWYYRLGHIYKGMIQKLLKDGYLDSFIYESYATCKPYLCEKMTNSPFSDTRERAIELLELIHSDVCGPISTQP